MCVYLYTVSRNLTKEDFCSRQCAHRGRLYSAIQAWNKRDPLSKTVDNHTRIHISIRVYIYIYIYTVYTSIREYIRTSKINTSIHYMHMNSYSGWKLKN